MKHMRSHKWMNAQLDACNHTVLCYSLYAFIYRFVLKALLLTCWNKLRLSKPMSDFNMHMKAICCQCKGGDTQKEEKKNFIPLNIGLIQ